MRAAFNNAKKEAIWKALVVLAHDCGGGVWLRDGKLLFRENIWDEPQYLPWPVAAKLVEEKREHNGLHD